MNRMITKRNSLPERAQALLPRNPTLNPTTLNPKTLNPRDWYAVAACIFEESCVFFRVLVHGFISTQGSSYDSQAVWLIFNKINHNGKSLASL